MKERKKITKRKKIGQINIRAERSRLTLEVVKSTAFFNKVGKFVGSSLVGILLAHLQDVFDTLKSHHDNLGIVAAEEFAECRNGALLHQESQLFAVASRSGIGNSPSDFFLDVEFSVSEERNQRLDKIGINDSLNLFGATCCDVRDGPARFFADVLLAVIQKSEQRTQWLLLQH